VVGQRSAIDKKLGSLLSPVQECTCQELAAHKIGLASQRAVALLSMNGGATQLHAGTESGLTIGQIRYLLNIFRRKGMAVFPVEQCQNFVAKPIPYMSEVEDSLIVVEGPAAPGLSVDKKLKSASLKDEKKHKAKKKEDKKNAKKQKKKEKAKKKKGKGKNKK